MKISTHYKLAKYLAPLFFILAAGFRCYLETALFGKTIFFSYYTVLHHVLWYLSAMLGGLLTLHFMLKIPFEKLVWLFYSAILFFIPILYALYTGQPLGLEYLEPDLIKILKSTLSACFLNPSNKPQFLEIILIDAGILGLSLVWSKNLKRAMITTLAVHLVLTLFAIQWFYTIPGSRGIIPIATTLSNHVWLCLVWLFFASLLVQTILIRADIPGIKMNTNVLAGFLGWIMAILLLRSFYGQISLFEAGTLTLPIYTLVFLGMARRSSKGRRTSPLYLIAGATLVFQLAAVLPILFNIQQTLIDGPRAVPF